MTPISFILCNYNAQDYFRFCHASIRKNLHPGHEVVLLDDGSTDGSADWLRQLERQKPANTVIHREPENIGIAHSYNKAVSLAGNERVCVLHTDMYVPPRFDERMNAGMDAGLEFLSGFRAEPPVYPPSVDKATQDFGGRLEEFDEAGFVRWAEDNARQRAGEVFPALFFPWMTTRTLFWKVGGVDLLFLKYMVDDDDLYLRVTLSGARVGQVRDAAVYHFGSRSTKFSGDVIRDRATDEWTAQYLKSQRNFIRKWSILSSRCWNEDMGLTPPRKYDVGLVLRGADLRTLEGLEPWADTVYIEDPDLRERYLAAEQPRTLLDLRQRVRTLADGRPSNGVLLHADAARLDDPAFALIQNLTDILGKVPGPGRYDLGPALSLHVRDLTTHEQDLVVNTRIFRERYPAP